MTDTGNGKSTPAETMGNRPLHSWLEMSIAEHCDVTVELTFDPLVTRCHHLIILSCQTL